MSAKPSANAQTYPEGKDSWDLWREEVSRWYDEKSETWSAAALYSGGDPVQWLAPNGCWTPLKSTKDIKAAAKGKL